MRFYSDEVGVDTKIRSALLLSNSIRNYSSEECFYRLNEIFSNIFERDVWVIPVINEALVNAQLLASILNPHGTIYCHSISEIYTSQADVINVFSRGSNFITVEGAHGKIDPSSLSSTLGNIYSDSKMPPSVVSLSQATEKGTVYKISEIKQITQICHDHSVYIYMDGSSFSHAVVALNCTPADLTWKSGIDALVFGTNRNGTEGIGTVVFFDELLSNLFREKCRHHGHIYENMWFPTFQLENHIMDNFWLINAAHANRMAQYLAQKLQSIPDISICHPVDANKIFIEVPYNLFQSLDLKGYKFLKYPKDKNSKILRLVTSFKTTDLQVKEFLDTIYSELHLLTGKTFIV